MRADFLITVCLENGSHVGGEVGGGGCLCKTIIPNGLWLLHVYFLSHITMDSYPHVFVDKLLCMPFKIRVAGMPFVLHCKKNLASSA